MELETILLNERRHVIPFFHSLTQFLEGLNEMSGTCFGGNTTRTQPPQLLLTLTKHSCSERPVWAPGPLNEDEQLLTPPCHPSANKKHLFLMNIHDFSSRVAEILRGGVVKFQ